MASYTLLNDDDNANSQGQQRDHGASHQRRRTSLRSSRHSEPVPASLFRRNITTPSNQHNELDGTTHRYYTQSEKSCFQTLRNRFRKHWHSLRTPMLEEGLDFDDVEDSQFSDRTQQTMPIHLTGLKWCIGAIIAITVAGVALAIEYCIGELTSFKYTVVNRSFVSHQLSSSDHTIVATSLPGLIQTERQLQSESKFYQLLPGIGMFMGINVGLVAIATLLVSYLDVKAKGSGVPEIKSYLNGRKIHRVIALRTFITKVVGVILSVSGSLVVGKEGPMMHAGAVLGSITSQFRAGSRLDKFGLVALRNDKEKRSFVSLGCACGVAAAFSAPLGGVLFVIEEAATYWSVSLTWLTFFACVVSSLLVDVLLSGMHERSEWGVLSNSAVVSFGSFEGASRDPCYAPQPAYRVQELPVFFLIGVLGGLAGAGFIALNEAITKWRMRHVTSVPWRRSLEALLVTVLTSLLIASTLVVFPCRELDSAQYTDHLPRANHTKGCTDLLPKGNTCGDWKQFSDMETLFMSSLDKSVRHLFHNPLMFRGESLLLFSLVTWFLGCVSYGISVPSGLFVPAIAIGSGFGRWVGQLLWVWQPAQLGEIDPGTYSLIGAAAMLGGTTRMTISIVVILLETTNNSTYAVPIMLTILTAKIVGDALTDGIYDMHIRLQGILFLHDDPEHHLRAVQARQVMVREPVVLGLVVKVSDLLNTLRSCTHNGFPVVSYPPTFSRYSKPRSSDTMHVNASNSHRDANHNLRHSSTSPCPPCNNFSSDEFANKSRSDSSRGSECTNVNQGQNSADIENTNVTPSDCSRGSECTNTTQGHYPAGFENINASQSDYSREHINVSQIGEGATQLNSQFDWFPNNKHQVSDPLETIRLSDEWTSPQTRGSATVPAHHASVSHAPRSRAFSSDAAGAAKGRMNGRPRVRSRYEIAKQMGLFEGSILRSTLLVLLFERQFVAKSEVYKDHRQHSAVMNCERFYKYYPRSPSLDDIITRLQPNDFDMYVDIRPYVNTAALSVHYSVHLHRVHQLFRTLGLRHLTVVDSSNSVVGIITRQQLVVGELVHNVIEHNCNANAPADTRQLPTRAVDIPANLSVVNSRQSDEVHQSSVQHTSSMYFRDPFTTEQSNIEGHVESTAT